MIIGKALILVGLALAFRIRSSDGWLFTLGLAQAGEFGFVLLTYSTQNRVIPADTAQMLSLVVALSMFLTPLLFIVYDRVVLPRYQKASNEEAEPDEIEEQAPVIVSWQGAAASGRSSAGCFAPTTFRALPWTNPWSRSKTCAESN